jgi:Trk-type K+ transport system membrane component
MIIAVHVVIALLSILWTTYGYLRPTNSNIRASYVLVALVFVSGFYLVWSEPAQMIRACMSGLAYLGIVSLGILATRRKLVTIQSEQA